MSATITEPRRASRGSMPHSDPPRTGRPIRGEEDWSRDRRRVVFVDVLRLLALLQMVNGHSLDSVMAEHLRHGAVFERYLAFRGLVSVAFMVAAGLSYHLTTFARFDTYLADHAGRGRRMRRAAWIIGIGFLLRFPFDAFGSDPVRAAESLANLTRIDVLHCIGLSILLLETISTMTRSAAIARTIAAALGVGLIAVAPFGQTLPTQGASAILSGWVSHAGGSPFPIAPWGAYVMLGAALGGWLIPSKAPAHDAPAQRLGLGALVTALAAMVLLWTSAAAGAETPSSGPWFVVQKLALVLAALALIAHLTRRVARLPRWLGVLAGETLTLYVFHLLALFWFAFSPHRIFGHSLELHHAAIVSLIMIAASVAVGLFAERGRAVFRNVSASIVALRRPAPRPGATGVGFAPHGGDQLADDVPSVERTRARSGAL